MTWKFEYKTLPKINDSKKTILISGLPGIGNVGKIAIDFVVDELKAKKLANVFSYDVPNSVFVNEKNLVELPSISLYFKETPKFNIIFLTGDFQPTSERASFSFSEELLDFCIKLGLEEVVTLGGIGLASIPKEPKIYCTGNNKNIVKEYSKDPKIISKLFGVVGPIIGVNGLLIGIASRKKINGVSILAETFGHPMYLGIKSSREIVEILSKKLELKINVKKLDSEIKKIETEMKKTKEITNLGKAKEDGNTSYIG